MRGVVPIKVQLWEALLLAELSFALQYFSVFSSSRNALFLKGKTKKG
jgi:hypothetical protein